MEILRVIVALLTAVLISIPVTSFEARERRTTKAINVIQSESSLKKFTYLCKKTGWLQYLGIINNITVFAPEDSVFTELSSRTRRMIIRNIHRVYDLVGNHMHFGRNLYIDGLKDGQSIEMGFGDRVRVNVRNEKKGLSNGVWVNGKRIKRRIETTNGVIHIINGILASPTMQLIEFMQYQYSHFGGFLKLLERSGMLFPPEFTIFVPISACFKGLPKDSYKRLLTDKTLMLDLVKFHIIPGLHYIDTIPNGVTGYQTLAGKTLVIHRDASKYILRSPWTNSTANVITPDLRVKTGLIHVIDAILEPHENMLAGEVVQEYKVFSFFAKMLKHHGFNDLLKDRSREFTVFAPKDSAWRRLHSDDKQKLKANETFMRQVISNHIREGALQVSHMKDYTQVTTLLGEKMMLRKYGFPDRKVMVNEAVVDQFDRKAVNGIIHVVDRVLLPKTNTLWDVIEDVAKEDDVSMFRAALRRTGVWRAVAQDDYYRKMIFAPTDEAFRKIPRNQLQYLMDNRRAMRDLIRYHITPGYFHTDLMDERWIYVFKTLHNRRKIRMRKKRSHLVTFNPQGKNAKSVKLDIVAKNGLLNIVDEVLIPPDYAFLRRIK